MSAQPALDQQPDFFADHHRLDFERLSGRTTEATPLAMREAATYGSIFAGTLDRFEGKPKAEFDAALARELERRTTSDNASEELLFRIAFLVRAVEEVRDPEIHKIEGYRPHTMSIMAQHAITRAKLGLKHDVISALWYSHEVVGVDVAQWRKTLTGAFRVATLAERLSFDSFGWRRPVYLPTVDEDRAAIDLFVTNGLGQGVSLQVKSHEEAGIRLLKLVDEPSGGALVHRELNPDGSVGRSSRQRSDEHYQLCRQLWLATQEFNQRYNLAWEPILAFVPRSV